MNNPFRQYVAGVEEQIPLADGEVAAGIQFDNAATTPPFFSVLREIERFASLYASIHRGSGYKSELSSEMYEKLRLEISSFVGADSQQTAVIYTKNTTEAINIMAECFYRRYPEAVILLTAMEHAANDLPWRKWFRHIEYARTDECGRLDCNDVQAKLKRAKGKIKLLAVTGASNVTGFCNPIHELAVLAHSYGAMLLVDGAQLVPHTQVCMQGRTAGEAIDFLAFSAHKLYAPFGSGALLGRRDFFAKVLPAMRGGGIIRVVTTNTVEWKNGAERQEAGTPNLMGILAMVKAMRRLKRFSMERVHLYEQQLIEKIINGLQCIEGIQLFGCPEKRIDKVSIITMSLAGLPHRQLAEILAGEYGIFVRSGMFCAHPYVQRLLGLSEKDMQNYLHDKSLPLPGIVRVSLGLYNTVPEAEAFLQAMRNIAGNKQWFRKKYADEALQNKRFYLP